VISWIVDPCGWAFDYIPGLPCGCRGQLVRFSNVERSKLLATASLLSILGTHSVDQLISLGHVWIRQQKILTYSNPRLGYLRRNLLIYQPVPYVS
jgi:hypothetical protein